MSALLPPALLLLWSGVTATCIAGLVVAPLLGETLGGIAPTARPARASAGVLLGVFLLPLLYGIAFRVLHEANLLTGALLGLVHATALGVHTVQQDGAGQLRAAGNRIALCVLYGALLGFTYVTP